MNYTYTITATNESKYGFIIYKDKEIKASVPAWWDDIKYAHYAALQMIDVIRNCTDDNDKII